MLFDSLIIWFVIIIDALELFSIDTICIIAFIVMADFNDISLYFRLVFAITYTWDIW